MPIFRESSQTFLENRHLFDGEGHAKVKTETQSKHLELAERCEKAPEGLMTPKAAQREPRVARWRSQTPRTHHQGSPMTNREHGELVELSDDAAFALGKHVLALCGVSKARNEGVTELGRKVAKAAIEATGVESLEDEEDGGGFAANR